MDLNKANKRETDAQYGLALALDQTDARQYGALDRVLKLQNVDGSKRFPLVKRTKLHRLAKNAGKGRKTNDKRSVLTVQEEEMLALYIRLKGLGDQAVTRKEIKVVVMSLLARRAAVNRLGGKIEKLSKVAVRALEKQRLDKSCWARFFTSHPGSQEPSGECPASTTPEPAAHFGESYEGPPGASSDDSPDYSLTTDRSFGGEGQIMVPRSRPRRRQRAQGAPSRTTFNTDEAPKFFDPSHPSP